VNPKIDKPAVLLPVELLLIFFNRLRILDKGIVVIIKWLAIDSSMIQAHARQK
jgi:hypothetical protein